MVWVSVGFNGKKELDVLSGNHTSELLTVATNAICISMCEMIPQPQPPNKLEWKECNGYIWLIIWHDSMSPAWVLRCVIICLCSALLCEVGAKTSFIEALIKLQTGQMENTTSISKVYSCLHEETGWSPIWKLEVRGHGLLPFQKFLCHSWHRASTHKAFWENKIIIMKPCTKIWWLKPWANNTPLHCCMCSHLKNNF